ncbi:MAG: hypothetical protein HY974_04510 [Candidatus Kerfeldbacteria bacterium]|nr:hypothetical protein [Candidatus Kerfeldbacteria bacterium]
MSDNDLIHSLHELRDVKRAAPLWREQTRARLMQTAEQSSTKAYSFTERFSLVMSQVRLTMSPLPLVPTLAIVVGLLFGWTPFAQATLASLPGDTLYPVKRASEHIALSLHSSAESQGLYYLALADRRVTELSTPGLDAATQAKLLRDYNINLGFSQASFHAAPSSSRLAVAYDAAVGELAIRLKSYLPEVLALPAYATALNLTDRLGSDALAVLVTTHQSAQNGLLPAAVARRLEQEIVKVEAKLRGMESKMVSLPTTKTSPRVVIESKQVVVPVRQAQQLAKDSLTEARKLVQSKEFTLALEKVRESEDITSKTEAAVDKAADTTKPAAKVEGAQKDNTPAPAEVKPADVKPIEPITPAKQ